MSERPFLEFFIDKENHNKVTSIKINEPVNAGSSKEIVLWVMNITGNELVDIRITADDDEVEISPNRIPHMTKKQVVQITLTWKPSIKRRTKLSTKLMSIATEVIR